MNPVHKKIPVLIHDDKPVCESQIALQYIDEVWNEKSPLLPSDPYQRAQARFWAHYIDTKLYVCTTKAYRSKGEEEQEAAKKELIQWMKVMEEELGDKPYFGGETFGYVDVVLVPFYCWFYTYETCANFSIEAECPELIVWAKSCMEKKSVAKSPPDQHKVYDFVLQLRKTSGID